MRAKVAPIEKKKGSCRSCGGTRCEICKHVVTTETFRSFSTKREYCIKPNNLNCRSNNVVYCRQTSVISPSLEDDKHHGMSDWEINLIDQTESVGDLFGSTVFLAV